MSTIDETRTALRTGEEFKAGLRDGRTVYVGDRLVEDVTTEPSLGPGITLGVNSVLGTVSVQL